MALRRKQMAFIMKLPFLLCILLCVPFSQAQRSSILGIAENKGFTTLVTALEAAGLDFEFSCTFSRNKEDCPLYSFFAPNEEAFSALDKDLVNKLTSGPYVEHLRGFLNYHVLPGKVRATPFHIQDGARVETLLGESIVTTKNGKDVMINNAKVLTANIGATNGLVHVVDTVLLPKFLSKDVVDVAITSPDTFSTFVAAANAAGLLDALRGGPITVLIPTNDAMAKIGSTLTDLLKPENKEKLAEFVQYHILPGIVAQDKLEDGPVGTLLGKDIVVDVRSDKVVLNGEAQITDFNILAKTGIIHEIDTVLTPPEPTPDPKPDIVDVAIRDDRLSTLVQAISAAGMVDTLKSTGPITVFAPTDASFAKLGPTLTDLLKPENKEELQEILQYHVVPGIATKGGLKGGPIETLLGAEIDVDVQDGNVVLNEGVKVTDFNILATNGIIHIIDTVLIPSAPLPDPKPDIVDFAKSDERFSTAVQAVLESGLVDTLKSTGPFTMFLPTNMAFAKLGADLADLLKPENKQELEKILQFHVLEGNVTREELQNGPVNTLLGVDIEVAVQSDSVVLNGGAQVTDFDILAMNGIIHVIDTVLLPPKQMLDIVDFASSDERFSTLGQAVSAAGLVDTLKSTGPFTIFLPTNTAFAKLGTDLAALLKPENKQKLAEILQYHVLDGNFTKEELENGPVVTRLGKAIDVSLQSDMVVLNDEVKVTDFNIMAKNGVIHVIDTVLLPPDVLAPPAEEPDVVDVASSLGYYSFLVEAMFTTGLVEKLRSTEPLTILAPTDNAFTRALRELGLTLPELFQEENRDTLKNIILYHVIPGEVTRADLRDGPLTTQLNIDIDVDVEYNAAGSFKFAKLNGETRITGFDTKAKNGIIHRINNILMPPKVLSDIVQVVSAKDRFSNLAAAAEAAGLVDMLKSDGPFTIFAPSNEAFAKLGTTLAELIKPENKQKLEEIIQYHILPGRVVREQLKDGPAMTLLADTIDVDVQSDSVVLNGGVQVTDFNILAKNGIVHVIDTVLLPPERMLDILDFARSDERFSTLVQAVSAAGLVETLKSDGPLTIFLPTNTAFAKLGPDLADLLKPENKQELADILQYHALDGNITKEELENGPAETLLGKTIDVNLQSDMVVLNSGVRVTDFNILAKNGIIHVIDTILLPPEPSAPPKPGPDVVDVASSLGYYSILVEAAWTAGLIDTLRSAGKLTLLAPTNNAFERAVKELELKMDDLLKEANRETLKKILLYHVLPREVTRADLQDGPVATALEGETIDVDIEYNAAGGFKYAKLNEDARITRFNTKASNGIIHRVNEVLIPPEALPDIVEVASSNSLFSTLAAAVEAAGLVDALREGAFTLLAPTSEAFAKLGPTLSDLLKPENKQKLAEILQYHILPGTVAQKELKEGPVKTLLGKNIDITMQDDKVVLNGGVQVMDFNILAKNGMIHAIDTVLLPPEPMLDIVDFVSSDERFSTLAQAVSAAGLTDTLKSTGPFTLFVPTDEVFAKLGTTLTDLLKPENKQKLAEILEYHVLSGNITKEELQNGPVATLLGKNIDVDVQGDMVVLNNGVKVNDFNIMAKNGIIHVIDTVLLPPEPMLDIVDRASSDERLSTFVQAVLKAGWGGPLQLAGPFTIFAPTNIAFAKLGTDLTNLFKPEYKTRLVEILQYHVVPGNVTKEELENGPVGTLLGEAIDVALENDMAVLNGGAKITDFDLLAKNGVIHVIDTVLIPPIIPAPPDEEPDIVDIASSHGYYSILVDAVSTAGFVDLLKSDGPYTLLAPTNRAFAQTLKGLGITLDELLSEKYRETLKNILRYHVIPGEVSRADLRDGKLATGLANKNIEVDVKYNRAGKFRVALINGDVRMTAFDTKAKNGIIHRINKVLIPPKDVPPEPLPDIYRVIRSRGRFSFSILVKAVRAAGLVKTLQSNGPYTLFSPTNYAFKSLLDRLDITLEELVADVDTLTKILLYHVVPRRVSYADLRRGSLETALRGEAVQVNVQYDRLNKPVRVSVNHVDIIATDIEASNGIVHVIDHVLVPPDLFKVEESSHSRSSTRSSSGSSSGKKGKGGKRRKLAKGSSR